MGRKLMILAAIYVIAGVLFFIMFARWPLLAALNAFFGTGLFLAGYALHRWEEKPFRGWRSDVDMQKVKGLVETGGLMPGLLPPPKDLEHYDPETGEKLCLHFFYDEKHRLSCLPDCKYPAGSGRAACTLQQTTPTCPYPRSREPMARLLMPQPVAWCPGPGGCIYFDEKTYRCKLNLSAKPHETQFVFEHSYHRVRDLGYTIMAGGIIFGLLLYIIASRVNLALGGFFLLAGVFVTVIGGIIAKNAQG